MKYLTIEFSQKLNQIKINEIIADLTSDKLLIEFYSVNDRGFTFNPDDIHNVKNTLLLDYGLVDRYTIESNEETEYKAINWQVEGEAEDLDIGAIRELAEAFAMHGQPFTLFLQEELKNYPDTDAAIDGFEARYIGVSSSPAIYVKEMYEAYNKVQALKDLGFDPNLYDWKREAKRWETKLNYKFITPQEGTCYIFKQIDSFERAD